MRKALAAGVLISLCCFALVFWAVSRFLPLFLRVSASPWFEAIVLLSVASGPLTYLRKHRRKTNTAHR